MLFSNKLKNFVNSKKILSKKEFEKKIANNFCYEVSKNKLKHDMEQINFLLKRKLIKKNFKNIIKSYKCVLNVLPKENNDTDIFTLTKKYTKILGPTFNNLIYFQPPDIITNSTISEKKKILKTWKKDSQYIVIDNFLSKEALNELLFFCLSNTIWNEFDYKNGYLGSFIENGFNSPLILQISEELKLKFPKLFKNYPLTKAWGFKCNNEGKGIKIHADYAAINVNFWITPDNANLNKNNGGLLIWNKEAPKTWDFEKYNNDHKAIKSYLIKKKAKIKRIKYKSNRAIIFNSNLFHATDKFIFKKKYESRRINITLLYGQRERSEQFE